MSKGLIKKKTKLLATVGLVAYKIMQDDKVRASVLNGMEKLQGKGAVLEEKRNTIVNNSQKDTPKTSKEQKLEKIVSKIPPQAMSAGRQLFHTAHEKLRSYDENKRSQTNSPVIVDKTTVTKN